MDYFKDQELANFMAKESVRKIFADKEVEFEGEVDPDEEFAYIVEEYDEKEDEEKKYRKFPYTKENCDKLMDDIEERIENRFCLYAKDYDCDELSDLDLKPLDEKAVEESKQVAKNYCKKRAKESAYTRDIEFSDGMSADYVHRSRDRDIDLVIRMGAGLPSVLPSFPNAKIYEDGRVSVRTGNLCEFGSEKSKDFISPYHYLRDWGEKIQTIIDANIHLFKDESYWETAGDRQVAQQVRSGVPYDMIGVNQVAIEQEKEYTEKFSEDTVVKVMDNRIVKSYDEKHVLYVAVSDLLEESEQKFENLRETCPSKEECTEEEVAQLKEKADTLRNQLRALQNIIFRL